MHRIANTYVACMSTRQQPVRNADDLVGEDVLGEGKPVTLLSSSRPCAIATATSHAGPFTPNQNEINSNAEFFGQPSHVLRADEPREASGRHTDRAGQRTFPSSGTTPPDAALEREVGFRCRSFCG